MKFKLIFINIILLILLFIFSDFIFSNFIYKTNIDHKCYEFENEGKFYRLQKNCFAKMRLISGISSFNVYTDNNGNRFSGSEKNSSDKNIYFFGDSQTFGLGSEWKNTFVGIIESKKEKYKVINLGVPSYSPSVFYYLLHKLNNNKKINNDKIYVLIDLTDVADEAIRWNNSETDVKPFLNSAVNKKNNRVDEIKKFKRENLKGLHLITTYIREMGRTFRKKWIRKKIKVKDKNQKLELGTWPGRFTYTDFEKLENCNNQDKKNKIWTCGGVNTGLKKIEEKMKKFGQLAKLKNSEFYIIIFPWPETLNFGQSIFNWEDYIENICKISGCKKVVNLFPEFRKIKETRKDWVKYLYLSDDFHLTTLGNKIVAEMILKETF